MIIDAGSDAANLEAVIRERVASRHVDRALALIAEALDIWRSRGFPRWNDHEVSCTVVIHALIDELVTRDSPLGDVPVWPEYESPELTAEHAQGLADPARARRRDLVLYFGRYRELRFPVECKRFIGAANAQKYVDQGMLRFLVGAYEAPLGSCAMVAYVMTRTVASRVAEINGAILAHTGCRDTDVLRPADPILAVGDVRRSRHATAPDDREVTMVHLLIDMRSRGAATQASSRTAAP